MTPIARTTATDPLAPGTVGYWLAGHPLILQYANVPALLMPTFYPRIAHVLSEKDRTLNGSVKLTTLQESSRRLRSTYEMVAGIVWAGPQGDDVAHGLYELHRPIAGTMPDGTRYHAWNADMWNWTWGSILKGIIDVTDAFKLLHGDDEREAAYQALNELGRRFGVNGLPDDYAGFLEYWQPIVDSQLEANPQVQFILDNALNLPKPRGWDRVPMPLWRLISLPATRTLRVGILAGVPEKLHPLVGLRITRIDRIERQLHGLFWRSIPRSRSGQFGPKYFDRLQKSGRAGWQGPYSRETLEAHRPAADAIRHANATAR